MRNVCINVRLAGARMEHTVGFLEHMDMPNAAFPFKIHHTGPCQQGDNLFAHHWHAHMELLYITQGQVRIECNSHAVVAGPGDLVVVNGNDLHYGVSLSDGLYYHAVIFDLSLLQSHYPDSVETRYITPISQNQVLFTHHVADPKARGWMEEMVAEWQSKEDGYELAIKSALYMLITYLYRHYQAPGQRLRDYRQRMKNMERFTPILHYINSCYHEPISVEYLAEQANLSRYHFSRLFKELTNRSIKDYVNAIRMNKAEHLLRNTELSLAEIAEAVGCQDIYYFSRLFKAYKKIPPSEVRKGREPGPAARELP